MSRLATLARTLAALSLGATLHAGALTDPGEPERYDQLTHTFYQEHVVLPAEAEAAKAHLLQQQRLLRQYPDSQAAADFEFDRLKDLEKNRQWDSLLQAVPEFVQRFPRWTIRQMMAVRLLTTLAANRDVPPETRVAATRAVAPLLQGDSAAINGLVRPLRDLPLADEQRYELARQIDDASLPLLAHRGFLWAMLEPMGKTWPTARFTAEVQRYIDRYDSDTPEVWAAHRVLLEKRPAQASDAQQQLSIMRQQQADADTRLKAAAAQATQAMEAGRESAALDALDAVSRRFPLALAEPAWVNLRRDWDRRGFLARLSPDGSYRLASLLLDNTRANFEVMRGVQTLLTPVEHEPRCADLILKHIDQAQFDRWESWFYLWHFCLNRPIFQRDRDRRVQLLHAGAAVLGRLQHVQGQGALLHDLVLNTWVAQPDVAAQAVNQLQSLPRPQTDVVAYWLVGHRLGDISLVRDPLPLSPRWLDSIPPLPPTTLPTLPQPALTTQDGGVITLIRGDGKTDIVAGQPTFATSGSDTAALAVDGKKDTFWTPTTLPAALTVQLKQPVAINRIRLVLREKAHLIVTLLDHQGRTVARYDRDQTLQDYAAVRFANNPVELRLAGEVTASFLRVELYRSIQDQPGLDAIEVQAAPLPSQAMHLLPAQALTADARGVAVRAMIDEPTATTMIAPLMENVQPFPFQRWEGNPWFRGDPRWFRFSFSIDNLVVGFFGSGIDADAIRAGGARWQVEHRKGRLQYEPPTEIESRPVSFVQGLPEGRHLLWLQREALPQRTNRHTPAELSLSAFRVTGRSRAQLLVRFGNGQDAWGPWLGPIAADGNAAVALPTQPRPTHVQAAVAFDTRGTQATVAASVRELQLVIAGSSAEPGIAFTEPSVVQEELDAVADLLRARKVVVAYAQTGTRAEFEAAKKLADTAGVYLAPDDLDMAPALYRGVRLAVGTPQRNRVIRQLVARVRLWEDPAYLNNPQGVVGLVRDFDGNPDLLFVTGETSQAVLAAAARLQAQITPYRHQGPPITLADSSTLANVYPWQLQPDATPPKELALRLGLNDRRSAQIAMTAHRALTDLTWRCDPLTNERGQRLAVRVRGVGFTDSPQLLGNLRVPNVLIDQPRLPMPANTAMGLWVTVNSYGRVEPGRYRGELVITADGYEARLPLHVQVESLPLPPTTRVTTYSFAYLPPGVDQGGPIADAWTRGLLENQADHGNNMIALPPLPVWRMEHPHRAQSWLAADAGAGPTTEIKPQPLTRLICGAGQVAHLAFAALLSPRQIAISGKLPAQTAMTLEAWIDGRWRIAADPITLPPESTGMLWEVRPGTAAQHWRVRSEPSAAMEIDGATALIDSGRAQPFSADFSPWERMIAQADAIYAERGLPKPKLLTYQSDPWRVSGDLGVPGLRLSRQLARQVAAHARQAGWFDRMITKVGDEPARIAEWTEMARPFREGGLRVMTCHGNYPNIDVAVGVLEPWCPNYAHDLFNDFFKARRAAGDELWWYCCGTPANRLTGPPTEGLPFYWLTAKWKFDGALSFGGAFFNASNVAFRLDHGMDHRIVYMPDGQVLDTTRREIESDGIHDLKLTEFIRARAAAARPQRASWADAIDGELDQLLEATVPWRYTYAAEPGPWEAARQRLYDLALRAQRAE